MIHGHTSLKLYNPISGNVIKHIEKDNTFQDVVIAKALRNLGECNASILNNSSFKASDYWKETVGGILLFKNEITSDTSFMSAGNEMTANGCVDVTNSSNPSELGSYNSLESSISTSPRKLVMTYDWGTSQGNGKISSVCLTSKTGGYIGYGNKSLSIASTKYAFTRNLDIQAADSKTTANAQAVIINNYKYTVVYDGAENLTIKKKKVCITTGSVFDGLETQKNVSIAGINPLSWTWTGCFVTASEDKLYILPYAEQVISPNGTGYFYEYDIDNETISLISFTNNSSKTLQMVAKVGGGYHPRWDVSHGKVFVGSSGTDTNTTEVFRLSDSLHLDSIDCGHTTMANKYLAGDLPNGLTLVTDDDTNHLIYTHYIYDSVNHTVYPTNASMQPYYNSANTPYIFDEDMECFTFNQQGVKCFNNPLYLATVNNITEVIKDGTMAMKVIYSLEESS